MTERITLEIVDGPLFSRDDEGWDHYAYTVELKRGAETMSVPWRQGAGITEDPTAATVLESLLSDAGTTENAETFEDWAGELGYDSDSRKAERIYRAVREQTDNLRRLLGEDFDASVFPDYGEDSEPEQIARRLAGTA